jgi:SET domain-containing protein
MNHWIINTEIKPSKIHGIGRFTLLDIKKNSVVLILNGNITLRNDNNKTNMPVVGTGYVIECDQTYMNHDENGNLSLDGQILFRANTDIRAGSELTTNYGCFAKGQFLF